MSSNHLRTGLVSFAACVAAALGSFIMAACAESSSANSSSPVAAKNAEFPNDWYFYGEKRPAALRALEGKPAPALQVKDWIGEPETLADLKGKVVVVDVWATWCGPCVKSLPHNVEMMTRHEKDGLMIIGVHESRHGADKMPAMAKDKSINYPMAVDVAGKTVKAYGVSFFPTYVVIDRAGVVRAAGLQPHMVDEVVEKLLAEKA